MGMWASFRVIGPCLPTKSGPAECEAWERSDGYPHPRRGPPVSYCPIWRNMPMAKEGLWERWQRIDITKFMDVVLAAIVVYYKR